MKIIIKPFAEIMVKSKPVRKRFLSVLQTNLTIAIKKIDLKFKVSSFWDNLEVNIFSDISTFKQTELKKIISRIPWVESFIEVEKIECSFDKEKEIDFNYIWEKVLDIYLDKIIGKSFSVRVKRIWKHSFSSPEIERHLWWYLLKKLDEKWYKGIVNLKNPDIKVGLEINSNTIYIVKDNILWIWGFPIWTQDKVISLISGWFDSSVSTFSMMKRWCKVDFLFFNLGWSAHELWVKQVSYFLNQSFSSWYNANIITVPFENIIKELLTKVNHRYIWVILKRLMLRVADLISKESNYLAIIKWDSLWQVSSQTLKNMFVIDKVCETLVLRPLISFNKQEIVDLSKKIGTYNFAVNMPEYCWIISDSPSTWANLKDIIEQENNLDNNILIESYNNKKIEKVENIVKDLELGEIELSYLPWENEIIIDIRESSLSKKNPIVFENVEVLEIPFFDINNRFKDLDQAITYLFYCDKWVLSNLHWLYLKEKWFTNIKVFRPIKATECKIL